MEEKNRKHFLFRYKISLNQIQKIFLLNNLTHRMFIQGHKIISLQNYTM